jgi:hemoglobin
MQIVKIGKPTFFSSEGVEQGDDVRLLLNGNLHIPITVEILDESLEGAEESNETLYDKIGGEKAIDAATALFYRKVLEDQHICRFFHYTDMAIQVLKQKAFLTYVFGGPIHYTGKDMRKAHELFVKMGLDDSHFDAVLGHLVSSFQELNVPINLINKAVAIAESVRDDVLGR